MTAALQTKIPDFAIARLNMVEGQLRPNKVRDERILQAMGALPRELFVPSTAAGIAYSDEDVLVAKGRYLLEPMVLARLLEEVKIRPNDRVLDIAPATGYSTAVIASMVKQVTALESDLALQKQAMSNLQQLQISDVPIELGALGEGWKANALYNVILINGAVDSVPSAILDQLAEGGRLVTVMRQKAPAAHTGAARLYEKIRGTLSHRALFDANVKLLPEFESKPVFTF